MQSEEDGDFEVTADMLIHDTIDDEATLAAEEALQTQEEEEEEICGLQEEGDMPLERLLALYGYTSLSVQSEPPEDGIKNKSESNTHINQSDSGSRSRRRKKVVPLEPQKEVTPDPPATESHESTNHESNSSLLCLSKENTAREVSMGIFNDVSQTGTSEMSLDESKSEGACPSSKGKEAGLEETDGEEVVDVVEVDDQEAELVSEGKETSEEDMSVVRMDDIESTGLNRDEEVDPAEGVGLDVVKMDDIEAGLSRIRGGLRLEPGEEKSMPDPAEWQEEDEDGDGAVYDDIMLSSTNAHLLSEKEDGPSTEPEAPDRNVGRTYVRGSRLRPEVPERRSMRLISNDTLNAYFETLLSDLSGSESDDEYSPQEDWKKEIKVGERYQALIPESSPCTPYPSSAHPQDQLMWSPRGVRDDEVSAYLESLAKILDSVSTNPNRDHEQALQVLQRCNHDIKAALKVMAAEATTDAPGMKPWSEEECQQFEEGLNAVKKDFFHLQRKVPTRSVKELVEFYYLWKKTERYDIFIQQYGKIGQRKILVPPGHVSDFMGKYLDMHNSDALDVHYLTTTVHTEMKKDNS